MAGRLVLDLGAGVVTVGIVPTGGGLYERVSQAEFTWPLDADELEDLRWYLEDYLQAPYGVWEDRGPGIQAGLAEWGDLVFASVLGYGPARLKYERERDRGLELVFRSADPGLLGLPWELMRDGSGPVALGAGGISRSLPVADGAGTLEIPGGRLRVLMVICRPAGTSDVGYQMVARPLLERLNAVRGEVDLTVLRPPTFDALRHAVTQAADGGEPFHVVHFDGHGVMPGRFSGGSVDIGGRRAMMTGPGEGVLAFEQLGGGSDHIGASKVAAVLAEGKVPVVVLNACQSGAVGKELEASVATALLSAGCAAIVAMAYSVYAVAAADFMAAFYEALFTGASVGQAVAAGRRRLFAHDGRPSPKGDMPLADWLVPVHYLRKDVSFPQARTSRAAAAPSLDAALDQIRAAPSEPAAQDALAPVGAFVGRDDLFYRLETAARLQRVVVVTGPGGTGKTELAKGFARWWRDTGGVSDPQLVLWYSFEPGVANFGLDGVITAIGLAVFGADFAPLDPPDRLAQVKRLLGQLRVLLVWDNFETVREMADPAGATAPLDEAGRTALKGFLDWVRDHSASTVIITSRAQENWLGQVRIEVAGLKRAEAAEYGSYLLAPHPDAQRRRERRSFGDLLDWLDGHPLAMRLTLPRLATTDPAELLAGLRGTEPLSTQDEPDAGRGTSLPASITYSYSHLSEQTRQMLSAVSLFHGVADEDILMLFSCAPSVPGRFAGVGKQMWTAVLEDAARVGLLTGLGSGMYQIHPALPGYLAAGWRAAAPGIYNQERQACEQALCAACAAFSRWLTGQIQSGDAAFAYGILGLQRRTLGAMLGNALDRHAWQDADDIVRALDEYWDTRGLSGEAAAWADRILDATIGASQTAADDTAVSLWLYTTIGQATRQKNAGQPDQAAHTYSQALNYLQRLPETDLTRENSAVLYHQLGMAAQDCGRLDEAEDWFRKSLTIEEELGNQPGMAITYHELGTTAQYCGRLDEAEAWYRKSLTIEEELGNRPGTAGTYHQLGKMSQERERLDEAEAWYRKSLAIREELGDQPGMADTYHELGITYFLCERLDEAEGWSRKSLTIKEEHRDRPGIASTYQLLGMIAQARGRLDEAEAWYRKSLTIEEELGDRPKMALTYGVLGLLAEDRQQLAEALDWMVRCVTLFDRFPHPMTGSGPEHLARLTGLLGPPALAQAWRKFTGDSVPDGVRDYVTSYPAWDKETNHD